MKIHSRNLDPALTKKFVEFCVKELDITPTMIVVEAENELEGNGLCVDINPGQYLILVNCRNRNLTEIYTTVAHELVHVKQYMLDNLGFLLDSSEFEYDKTWWEAEARNRSQELILKFVKNYEFNG
jgi:hypothetical protein